MNQYSKQFFERINEYARPSARFVVPMLQRWIEPSSVIDIGCGTGVWLNAFREHGVPDVFGIDGDYVGDDLLDIPSSCFQARDLCQPLQLNRRFDLAISLEVAEHIQPESADPFVESLCDLAPVVLFSAAIPHQGGDHHVNEQWPEYWAAKFRERNYVPLDILRLRLWTEESVAWWYAQNMLLFVHSDHLHSIKSLARFAEAEKVIPLVHPGALLGRMETNQWLLRACNAAREIADIIPTGCKFGLVDEGRLSDISFGDRVVLPFPEIRGKYGGPPSDDKSALQALTGLRASGGKAIVFVWECYWWLEHYPGLCRYLESQCEKLVENSEIRAYRL